MRFRTFLAITATLIMLFPDISLAARVDEESGLIMDSGFETVKNNCTVCHSAKMITQNRMDREGWRDTIQWMQKTQGLWKFSPGTEETILDYLSTHYGPVKTYRRPPLTIEWE